jgi:hypothetical protein
MIAGWLLVSGEVGKALTCDWTGAVDTDWANPGNWNNCGGGVPGAADTAAITSVANQPSVTTAAPVGGLTLGSGTTLTIASGGGNLSLDGPVFGAGNIVVDGILTWLVGEMAGTGVTTIQPGGTLSLLDMATKVLSRNLANMAGGLTTATGGNSSLIVTDGAVFANSGLYHIQNGSDITGAGRFENLATGEFRTSIGTGTVGITVAEWVNLGLVEVQTGTLSFAAGSFVHGGIYQFPGTRLYFPTGTHTVTGRFQGTNLEMNAPVDFLPAAQIVSPMTNVEIRGVATFDTGEVLTFVTLLLDGGTIAGSDSILATTLNWPSGTMTGSGPITVQPSGTLTLDGPGIRTLDRDLTNHGDAVVSGASGMIVIPPNRTFQNLDQFTIHNDSTVVGEGAFQNLGTFIRATSPGIATVDLDFHNMGVVLLQSGATIVHEYHQTGGATALDGGDLGVIHEVLHLEGGNLTGDGEIGASLELSGDAAVAPGTSAGTLTISGDYRQSEPTTLAVELDGTGAGQFDRLVTSGQASLGGALEVALSFAPPAGANFPLMTYSSRVGKFSQIDLPPPPAGLSWLTRYGAAAFTLRLQTLLPTDPLLVDALGVPGGVSNHNSILEPGEIVSAAPRWLNPTAGPAAVAGTASNFTGPAGAIYGIVDAAAEYGTIAVATAQSCADLVAGDCYLVTVDDPDARPAPHWDATFDEALTGGNEATYTVHVGDSFTDAPPSHAYYFFIETLLHNEVTAGCSGGNYCPDSAVTRAQMAVFLLVSRLGASYLPPEPTGTVFTDVPLGSFAAAFIEELSARQVTAGCDTNLYCPNDSVTREQMAVFLLRTLEGPTYVPPDCTEPPTFADVPCASPFAKWVEELVLRGITAGCAPGFYCPADPVTRGQMAVFLTATFGLGLNGP